MSSHGVAMAGNHLTTELVLATGAVEMMIVDYQCIMPSIGQVAACYHTRMISTSDKAKFPGMVHRGQCQSRFQSGRSQPLCPAGVRG